MISIPEMIPPVPQIYKNGAYIIDFSSLPHGSILHPDKLPRTPCVYFCLSLSNYPVYIGQSEDLRSRWENHDKKYHCRQVGATKLAWMTDKNNHIHDRKTVEDFFIRQYIPKFNGEIWNGLRGSLVANSAFLEWHNSDNDRYPLEIVKAAASPSNKFSRCYSYFYCAGHSLISVQFNSTMVNELERILKTNFGVNFNP